MEKTNRELFEQIQELSWKVKRLGGIVQNDVEIPSEQVMEWSDLVSDTINELENTRKEVLQHFLED